ncbi:MerR family transcriptional regulator [Xanthobacteraceae bacterium Astr-EGSB]|uniref:MerR family transcriptional regulator n=1 Tax=Astrobacterium formosum TaxID=3069710 RepID=UPI0027B2A44C|nr:MerR family transcriptional regulator [Xanthobacteraceae bacterium Astr-EGSB]
MEKSPDAFRTISEVAEELDVPQHVLRFWESRFPHIKPMKRGGGRRYYRPDDVDLLRGIRHLLYGEGYTIRGVQRILREQGPRFVQTVWRDGAEQPQLQPHEESAEDEGGETQPVVAARPSRKVAKVVDETSTEPVAPAPAPVVVVQPPAGPILSADDIERLRASLATLSDCKRRLEEALAG